jgi:hypothetical protein
MNTATAGLLLSLQASLPHSSPLSKTARRLAGKINRPHPRTLDDRAATVLSQLLDATDCADAAGYSQPKA